MIFMFEIKLIFNRMASGHYFLRYDYEAFKKNHIFIYLFYFDLLHLILIFINEY